jgi:hypothetical protein
MNGVIEGGWEYVIAVYVLSALVYALYTYSVLKRDKASRPLSGEKKS